MQKIWNSRRNPNWVFAEYELGILSVVVDLIRWASGDIFMDLTKLYNRLSASLSDLSTTDPVSICKIFISVTNSYYVNCQDVYLMPCVHSLKCCHLYKETNKSMYKSPSSEANIVSFSGKLVSTCNFIWYYYP